MKIATEQAAVPASARGLDEASVVQRAPSAPSTFDDLLEQCRDSGQMDADQVVAHQRAGEL